MGNVDCEGARRFPGLALIDQVLAAIEAEHEPAYAACLDEYTESVAVALMLGCSLVTITRAGDLVLAQGGDVFVNGRQVELRINQPMPREGTRSGFVYLFARPWVELAPQFDELRGRPWHPAVALPGCVYDAAYVFVALVGWQAADILAARALGCPQCRRGLLETDQGTSVGVISVPCSCQIGGCWDDEGPAPARPERAEAMEEPGPWYPSSGAAS